jgi:hypothetical protein
MKPEDITFEEFLEARTTLYGPYPAEPLESRSFPLNRYRTFLIGPKFFGETRTAAILKYVEQKRYKASVERIVNET